MRQRRFGWGWWWLGDGGGGFVGEDFSAFLRRHLFGTFAIWLEMSLMAVLSFLISSTKQEDNGEPSFHLPVTKGREGRLEMEGGGVWWSMAAMVVVIL